MRLDWRKYLLEPYAVLIKRLVVSGGSFFIYLLKQRSSFTSELDEIDDIADK